MSKQAIPPTWPKPYLLEVYKRAVAEGCVRLPLPSKGHFTSFSQAFYRLRRRSDAQHAAYILPEYHLVTCHWEEGRGTCLVTFNKMPDGHELPAIESVEHKVDHSPHPEQANDMLLEQHNIGGEDEDFDPDKFLQDLVDAAGKKITDEE